MTDNLDKEIEEYKQQIEKIDNAERERRRQAEAEREAERRRQAEAEEKRINDYFAKLELESFIDGHLANNTDKFEQFLKAGHTPTYDSCGGNLTIIGNTEVLKLACEYGLTKEDATKLLQKCINVDCENIAGSIGALRERSKYKTVDMNKLINKMKILIEHGHADVSKCSISNLRKLHDTVFYRDDTWFEHTGRYECSIGDGSRQIPEEVVIEHPETTQVTYSAYARDMFILLLQSGYKPETIEDKKDFVYLYGHTKEHLEKLEKEKRKQQEIKENFEKGVYYIHSKAGKPVGKCRAPLNFTYDGYKCSMLPLFNDTFGSKAKKLENLESIVEGNFGENGFSGNITASNQDISMKVQYKDGKMHGLYEEINSDGSVKKIQYKDGKMHGLYEKINSDGSVKKIQYKDGKMHGVYKEINPDGSVKIEKYYENKVDVTEKRKALKRIATRKIELEEKLEGKKLPKAIKRIGKAGFKIDSKIQAIIAMKKLEKTE